MNNQQTKENENVHKGHRQRLKDRVREGGLKALKEHEILELLLTYTIPQKDTNELAHQLLNSYGNINAVLSADYLDLLKHKGVGEETALFFHVLDDFYSLYRKNMDSETQTFLRTTQDCVHYFRTHHSIGNKEVMYLVCLNSMSKFVKEIELKGHNDIEISFNIKDIVSKLMDSNIVNVIMYHTHPSGSTNPSRADLEATQDILNACAMLKINLCDHIILNEFDHYSMGTHGELYELYNNFCKVQPNNQTASKMMQNINFIQQKKKD